MARPMAKENQTEHFNAKVPQALRDKMLALAGAIEADFISDQRPGESYGCPNTSAIYGYHVSGFIPSQLGGYEISDLYRSDVDTSYHLTKAQSDSVQAAEKHLYESFYSDYREELEKAGIKDVEAFSYSDLEATPSLQSKFEYYENEWYEPALLRCEIWIDDPEHKQRIGIAENAAPETVNIQVGLNYRDQPYYRTASDETLFTISLSIKTFMKHTPETIIRLMEKKMAEVK